MFVKFKIATLNSCYFYFGSFFHQNFSSKSKDSNSGSTDHNTRASSKETTSVRRSTTTVRSTHSYARTGQQAFHRTVTSHIGADMAGT